MSNGFNWRAAEGDGFNSSSYDLDQSNYNALSMIDSTKTNVSDNGHMIYHTIVPVNPMNKFKRHQWTDKKVSLLLNVVRSSAFATPWKPAHGTNKEVWTSICKDLNGHEEFFHNPIMWECAKEQLQKIIDKHKIRRNSGDLEIKSENDRYLDEILKHLYAEDMRKTEKDEIAKWKREHKKLQENQLMNNPSNESSIAVSQELHQIPKKRRKASMNILNSLPFEQLQKIANKRVNLLHPFALHNSESMNQHHRETGETIYLSEREKIILDGATECERIQGMRDDEREEMLHHRDQIFIKFIQQQITTIDALHQESENVIQNIKKAIKGIQ